MGVSAGNCIGARPSQAGRKKDDGAADGNQRSPGAGRAGLRTVIARGLGSGESGWGHRDMLPFQTPGHLSYLLP